ncbi:MAG: hypothetical protein AAF531_23920 [Actinomycetota bacterium]
MHADLQRLLNPNMLADIAEKAMDRLRSIRTELSQAEGDVSLVRRVTQGRLDIVGHEVERRSGQNAGALPADPSSLLFEMPDILTDAATGTAPSTGAGRPVPILEPGPAALAMIETLDAIASPAQLSGLDQVDDSGLGDLFAALREFEVELSSIRRKLHDRIDAIQDEIARRYRDGEASVDTLLQSKTAGTD